jgi:hypothetical protein
MELLYQLPATTELERASALLANVLGAHSSLVQAEWSPVPSQGGRPLFRLTIWDSTGKVSTDFTADELGNPLHMKVRLYRLWGDLLQIRNDQQHQIVERISAELAAGSKAG